MSDPERAPSEVEQTSTKLFPIAVVGASAGGLAPTTELLRALGPDPGLALVVIHHLDPTHESGLAEILARATPMPVAAAADGTPVERNHVYVVPPNAGLLIKAGVLQVVPRTEERGLHLPIDRFCESLALDRDGLAVAVVLSGSGFDGTEGVQAIKRGGGISLAQDGTAPFGSMPESAVRTGCVDIVAAPPDLARELRRIGASTPLLASSSALDAPAADYARVLSAMSKASGVDFANYKRSTIQRRVQRRVFLRGQQDLSAYAELLQHEPAEVSTLCEEVLIHVTSFFREPAAFEALCTLAMPKLCENRSGTAPLRVWVPGCSTGEEVYSLAIGLLEFLENAHLELPIKIFGTDLSQRSVEKARTGRYPRTIERDVSPARLQRFFTAQDAEYQIRRDVRDMCVFARHDVTRDPPFSAMDLISCRNLLIYLGPELQERVVALFHYALKEPGFLMLGGAETVRNFVGFAPLDAKHKLYARTSAAPRTVFDFATSDRWRDFAPEEQRSASAPVPRSVASSDIHREADRLVLAEFGPPGVVVTSDWAIVQFRGQTGPFVEPAPGAASLDLFRMAREELRLPLRHVLERARQSDAAVREDNVPLSAGDKRRSLSLRVVPFAVHSPRQRYFLVLFEEAGGPAEAARSPVSQEGGAAAPGSETSAPQELAPTRQYLESVIEQLEATNEELKAANEEVVSSNEELRITNEELQSAREELQATNEELRAVNEELGERNVEALRLSNDLTNVLSSAEVPMLIVGRQLQLRRFTPAAAKTFGLVAADAGRPLTELRAIVDVAPALLELLGGDVRERLNPTKLTVQDARGAWLELSVRPYLTVDGRIDGSVVVARDIDAESRATAQLEATRRYAEDVVDTLRDGVLVLDTKLCVRTTNAAFARQFGLEADLALGKRLSELGRPELASPALQQALTQLQQGGGVSEDVRIEQRDATGGAHAYLVNARLMAGSELVLLAFVDVTEAERARVAAARAEVVFQSVLTSAPEGVLIADASGKILFANPAASSLLGYGADELKGQAVELLLPDALREMHAQHRAGYLASPAPRRMARDRALVGRRKDGSEVPIEVSLSPMEHDGGTAVVAFINDITQRREAERKILAYQARLQRMGFDAALTEQHERRRIAIGLHDQVGQALALAQIKLSSIHADLTDQHRAVVDGAMGLLQEAIAAQRSLVFELSPPILYDLGLGAALAWLAEDVEKRYGVRLEIRDDGADKPLDDGAKAIVFRAVRELVMNVLKHARVPTATISLRRGDGGMEVEVQDQGVGFEPDALTRAGGGFGLLSVREQISGLGGTLDVETAAQQGTRVKLRVPLSDGAAEGTSEARPGAEGSAQ